MNKGILVVAIATAFGVAPALADDYRGIAESESPVIVLHDLHVTSPQQTIDLYSGTKLSMDSTIAQSDDDDLDVLDEEAAKKKKKKKAKSKKVPKVKKSIPGTVGTLIRGVDAWAQVGWEIGRMTSPPGTVGPYPGFGSAVLGN